MNILTKKLKKEKKILWQGQFENLLFFKNRNQSRTSIKNFIISKSYRKGLEIKNAWNKNVVTDKQKNFNKWNVTSC